MIQKSMVVLVTALMLHGPVLAHAAPNKGPAAVTQVRTSPSRWQRTTRSMGRLIRRVKKTVRTRLHRALNPRPTFAVERLYRAGRISRSDLVKLNHTLKRSKVSDGSLDRLLRNTAPRQPNDAYSTEVKRLKDLAARNGWVVD